MEYFLNSEAVNVKRSFTAHIGQEMAYNAEGDRAQLTNIIVQEGQDIVHMGHIQLGYHVRFVFGLTANIGQVDYCLHNGFEPIYATKHALTETVRMQIITHNNMQGSWLHKTGENYAKVEISDDEIAIETFMNGVKKTETISPHGSVWMGPLVFNNTGYYINSATEAHLSFGRDYPNDKWVATFTRRA